MDMTVKYLSELVDLRKEARQNKDWDLSDKIRDYLDKKQIFIFDTKDGQEIYYELEGMTRERLVKKINQEKRAEKQFDAWLYSVKN